MTTLRSRIAGTKLALAFSRWWSITALVVSLAGCERRSASDATITSAVKNKLAADPTTGAAKIDVDTSNGVVTLSGQVPTTAEK